MAIREKKNDYFEMMTHLVRYSCDAAALLKTYLADFNPSKLVEQMTEIHAVEHAADEERHDVLAKLSREFITPIERDDIYLLVQTIDDLTDAIDDVMIKLYMFNVKTVFPEAVSFSELIERCVSTLYDTMCELHNYKKSNTLHGLIVEINDLESAGDRIYMDGIRNAYTSKHDALTITTWKEIFDCLESCCDICEHVADAIENTIMKNS